MRSTHTLAHLELSPAALGEVSRLLDGAGQLEERTTDAGLDLTGVAALGGKRFRPLLDRVVVKRDAAPSVTAGGLHIPEVVQGKKNAQRGVVVAVGPGLVRPADEKLASSCRRAWERFNQLSVADADAVLIGDALAEAAASLRNPRPIPLKPGDVVYMAEWTGTEVEIDGEKLLLVREDDLIAVEDAS